MDIKHVISGIVKELRLSSMHSAEFKVKVLEACESAYSTLGRHYHNMWHLTHMLRALESFYGTEQEQLALMIATLFHDIVYDPKRSDNEERSAQRFLSIVNGYPISDELKAEVVRLIMVTKDHLTATTKLEQAFADADMMIFAEDEKTYSQYAANIRKEYNHLDDESYNIGRLNFLTKLQEYQEREGRLFYNLSSTHNERARQNIAREITHLKKNLYNGGQMKPRISMITLGTKDLAKATSFYENGLELPKMEFEGNVSFFTLNGTWLALYPWELLAEDAQVDNSGSGFRGVTLAHNVEDEKQVISLLEKAQNAGAKIVKPAKKTDWGGFSGYFADLDGHLWEVAHNPFFWPGPKD